MSEATLLIEIGTEELPPDHLNRFSRAFAESLQLAFNEQQIPYSQCEDFVTPRRIAARFHHVPAKQPDRIVKRKGPALNVAYDLQGQPTPALRGFAKSCGVDIADLQKEETPQGSFVSYTVQESGKPIAELLPNMIENALEAIPVKKKMRWGNFDLEFIRPIHWVCVVHGDQPIEINVFQLTSNNKSFGHPVHFPNAISITNADDYLSILKSVKVIADYRERKTTIEKGIDALAEKLNAKAVVIPSLLDQVTGLIEWPVVLHAQFDKAFLEVPQEALMSSMQNHQKCFPTQNAAKMLLPTFILVTNIQAEDNQHIIRGNERVMKARLEDAKFFFEQDRKTPLSSRLDGLKNMIFQKSLGTLYEKSHRISKLSSLIAKQIGSNPHFSERAAKLCKADLLTKMVFEFPELQGIMGCYYAKFDGEPVEVADAIEESYLPRYAKDSLPQSPTGISVALADRLDTLIGIFGIGQAPTGDKDPFALRRQALGILRILVENSLPLDLEELLQSALHGYGNLIDEEVIPQVHQFCFERFKAWELDQGLSTQVIESVMANYPTVPFDAHRRILAVNQFQSLPEAEHLAQANKRVKNILQKSGGFTHIPQLPTVDPDLLKEIPEQRLFEALQLLEAETQPLIGQGQYQEALTKLAQLQQPVDEFFEAVMVMTDDKALKENRLRLLSHLLSLFMKIADISKLAL